jgi:ATP-dependent DNA ligase
MKAQIFAPVESMNPIYLGKVKSNLYDSIIKEHGGLTCAEIKEDGYRVQVHKLGTEIKAYTRSKKPVKLELFPELTKSLESLPNCILDCELIGYKKIGHNGFNSVKKRFRHKITNERLEEYLTSDIINDFPLELRVFDTLNWEKESMINLPLIERRKYTEKVNEPKISPSIQRSISNSKELETYFNSLIETNYEGLVCKHPFSEYIPGNRSNLWIKLKRSESLDLIILGVYMNKNEISQLLCGCYNKKTKIYETLAKVNAKRERFDKELNELLKGNLRKIILANILFNPNIKKSKDRIPDFYISPEKSIVVEVAAMNFNYSTNWHSCCLNKKTNKSYSLRIGWLKNLRLDKTYRDIASDNDIKRLYDAEQEN